MATIALDPGLLGSHVPVRWVALAAAGRVVSTDQKPQPPVARTVRVRVGRQADDDPSFAYRLPAGVWWRPEADGGALDMTFSPFVEAPALGVLKFTYGSAEIQRTVFSDLASGEYQIPPCEFLTVTAARYTPDTDEIDEFGNQYLVDRVPVEVVAEIASGVAVDYTPMIVTAPAPRLTGWTDDVAKVAVPPGAYAFEIGMPDPSDGGRVEVWPPGAIRDFTDGQWLPPSTPIPIVSPYLFLRATAASAGRRCSVLFFVR